MHNILTDLLKGYNMKVLLESKHLSLIENITLTTYREWNLNVRCLSFNFKLHYADQRDLLKNTIGWSNSFHRVHVHNREVLHSGTMLKWSSSGKAVWV